MAHFGFASDARAGTVLKGSNPGVASQLFGVVDGLHFVGGDQQLGRDHGADARYGDHQVK